VLLSSEILGTDYVTCGYQECTSSSYTAATAARRSPRQSPSKDDGKGGYFHDFRIVFVCLLRVSIPMMASKEISDISVSQKDVSLDEASTPTSPSISIDNIKPVSDTTIPPSDPEKVEQKPTPPPYTAFTPNRQLFIVLIATAAGFFSPLTGAVYLPSLILFEKIFNTNSTVINATLTVYFTVFAVAPMFGAAASDYGGRKTVYVVTLAIFLASNAILAAVPPSLPALFVLRVFQVCLRHLSHT
jgi:Na+/melibiose symporter-like transporter